MTASNNAVLNYTANHTCSRETQESCGQTCNLGDLAESGVWPQILLNLHQHSGGVWAGAYDGKVRTVDPWAISVRPHEYSQPQYKRRITVCLKTQ